MAVFLRERGDYAHAEPLFRSAMEICKKAPRKNQGAYALCLEDLAHLYDQMHDRVRAAPLFREAAEIAKKTSMAGERDPEYARLLAVSARIYHEMRDTTRAEPLYRQALEIMKDEKEHGDSTYDNTILLELGLLSFARGDLTQAEALLRRALDIETRLCVGSGPALGVRPQLELLAHERYYLDIYLGVALEAGTGAEALYRHVLDWKGAWAGHQAALLPVQDFPELKPLQEELGSIRSRLALLAFTQPAPPEKAAWREQLDALLQSKERLEAEVSRRSSAYQTGRQSAAARRAGQLEGVAVALPAGTVLVDFVQYLHPSREDTARGTLRLLAFIVQRDRPVACVALGNMRPVGDAVLAWRAALLAQESAAIGRSAAALGRLVWEPLRAHLTDAKTVLVAPDSWLTGFPFAAMPGHKPGTYMIEDLAIGYAASGREAAALLASSQGTASGGLLAAGAIDFQADPGPGAPRHPWQRPAVMAEPERGGFTPLPGTKAEGELARELFLRAFPSQPAVFLFGGEATEGVIKKRLDGGHWRAVHLGTHGFFEVPGRIAALRASMRRKMPANLGSKPDQADDASSSLELSPFLDSGIVLAGGGRAPDPSQVQALGKSPPSEDGILTAEEVQSLDLRGTELVVLSACETGLGRGFYGQGVMGLQRAFHAAGARAVVASLWKVDDAATSVLMEQFYTNLWVKKMPKLEALRQAQITVLKYPGLVRARQAELAKRGIGEKAEKLPKGGATTPSDGSPARSDPSLWAAFVLSGDWR